MSAPEDIRFADWRPYNELDSIVKIEDTLRYNCPRLRNEEYPLLALVNFENGRFFLPIFYSLRQLVKQSYYGALRTWNKLIEKNPTNYGFLLRLLNSMDENIESELVDKTSKMFTIDTIMYCGFQYGFKFHSESTLPITYDDIIEARMQYWLEDMVDYLMMCDTFKHVRPVVLWIAKYCFPVVTTTGITKNYIWDPFAESWCLISTDLKETLRNVLLFIWLKMRLFMIREIKKEEFRSEREDLWLNFSTQWFKTTESWYLTVINGFKLHHDPKKLRMLGHTRIVKDLPEYNCANVPELYFVEERKPLFLEIYNIQFLISKSTLLKSN